MENFIVSARKYRPQTFDTVVGQNSITQTLKNAIRNNHLAQAFLFCGPRGVGKTTCARILAKTINCKNLSASLDACDECESCISFNRSASFNIHELDAASNNSVDDIRNLVDQVRIPPQVGKYKVYIIDEVHMLSANAFNAFLKTLEEPPEYAKFILATTEKHKIIPTILSRCQIYDFRRITVDDIAAYLQFVAEQENVTAEMDALHIIAQKSDGAMRDALSIFDQIVSFGGKNITYKNVIENLNVLDYDYYFKMVDAISAGDIKGTLLLINEIIDNGFDGQHFLMGFGEHLRNLLVGKDPQTIKLLEVGGSIKNKYLQQSITCSVDFLLKALDINNKCDIDYKNSNNKNLHLELALMKMCSLNAQVAPGSYSNIVPSAGKPKEDYTSGEIKHGGKPKEPEIIQSPQVLYTKGSSMPGTTSIKSLKKEKEPGNKKEPEAEDEKPSEDFTDERLQEVWKDVATLFIKDKNFYTTLTKRIPRLLENYSIELVVDNKIQEEEVKEHLQQILPLLRKELNNYSISFSIKVNEKPGNDKLYTPQDKFNAMAEKNPALRKLKDQLDLEIDY